MIRLRLSFEPRGCFIVPQLRLFLVPHSIIREQRKLRCRFASSGNPECKSRAKSRIASSIAALHVSSVFSFLKRNMSGLLLRRSESLLHGWQLEYRNFRRLRLTADALSFGHPALFQTQNIVAARSYRAYGHGLRTLHKAQIQQISSPLERDVSGMRSLS